MKHIVATIYRYTDDRYADDGYRMVRHVRVASRKLRGMDLYAFAKRHGLVPPLGCHCSHCAKGWDCCGRMFPARCEVVRAKRGLKITTTYLCNI